LTTVRAAGIVLAKELRLEFRTRELLTATVIFALVVVVLFSFAFDPTAAESRRYGPGLLWIAFLFAGSLMLNPSFAREQNNETLDALRMAPISSFAILLGKILANFIFMSLAELVLVPVFAVLYNLSLAGIVWRLILVLALDRTWLAFLAGFDIVFLTASWLLCDHLLEE
jgi:heme exporter protein B